MRTNPVTGRWRHLTVGESGVMEYPVRGICRKFAWAGVTAVWPWLALAADESAPPAEPPAVPAVAPAEVINSAIAAVQKLGDEVVRGRHEYAIERMYPRWKERAAKQLGGMDVLQKQLAGVVEQMQRQGISMLAFKPTGVPKAYEVGPGKKTEVVNGKEQEVMVTTTWMVLIPTSTKFRLIDDVGKYRYIERTGFQVAFSENGKNDWWFMDGSGITVADLRSLFPDVPRSLELPPLGGGEVEKP